jgi:hypothetical protein
LRVGTCIEAPTRNGKSGTCKNNNSTAWERLLALPHEQTVQHCFKRVCAVCFPDLDSQLPLQITNHLHARADGLLPCCLFDFMKQDLARCVAPWAAKKEGQPMEDTREKSFAVATNFWLNAGSNMLQQQASLLRLWADTIDKYAQNYEQGTEKLRSSVEREQHAA